MPFSKVGSAHLLLKWSVGTAGLQNFVEVQYI